jgi:hypothetical protein
MESLFTERSQVVDVESAQKHEFISNAVSTPKKYAFVF